MADAKQQWIGVCKHCASTRIHTRSHQHRHMIWRCQRCNKVFDTPSLQLRKGFDKAIRRKDIPKMEAAGMDLRKVERSIVHYTNKERSKRGLKELVPNDGLVSAARSHSKYMAKVHKQAHDGIGDGTVSSRAGLAGYSSRNVSENIWNTRRGELAYGTSWLWRTDWELGKAAVMAWMNSPGHCSNLLRTEWQHIGVGAAKAGDGRVYLTQVFGNSSFYSNPKSSNQPSEYNISNYLKTEGIFLGEQGTASLRHWEMPSRSGFEIAP